ncbi:MAG: MFS transporter [Mycobacteriales bacterium]
MVWALAVTETISYGVLFYAFAVFVVPMRDELGASTGEISAALSLAIAVNGGTAVLVGRWVDRHGTRALMTTGSLVGAAGVVAWSQAQDLPQLYAAFVLLGLAGAAVLYDPAFALINTWFVRDRNAALLTLTVVAGFASTIFLPTSQALVTRLGWRSALLVLAVVLGACAVPHAVLLRRSPADLGLSPDGVPDPPSQAHQAGTRAEVRGAWRRSPVRWLTVAAVAETVAVTVVAVHLVAYLRDTGAAPATAAAVAGALGILSVSGRVALTALARRVRLGRLAAGMVGGQAAGVGALFWLPRPLSLIVFVLLFGAGFGVMTIARAALLGQYVPARVFGSVSGRQSLLANSGRVIGPLAGGAVISAAGYGVAFGAVAACSFAAATALLAADRSAQDVADRLAAGEMLAG